MNVYEFSRPRNPPITMQYGSVIFSHARFLEIFHMSSILHYALFERIFSTGRAEGSSSGAQSGESSRGFLLKAITGLNGPPPPTECLTFACHSQCLLLRNPPSSPGSKYSSTKEQHGVMIV